MSDVQHIIGIGTGRSGTTSLARLLDGCDNVYVTHEDMPCLAWHKTEKHVERALLYWEALQEPRNATHVGDVAAWHLNYIDDYMRELDDVRVIAMWREEAAVVRSWCNVLDWKGFLLSNDTPGQRMWPTFEEPLEQAVSRYWRIYQHRVDKLMDRYPDRVHRVDISHLNTEYGQSRIQALAGIPEAQRNPLEEPKKNTSGSQTTKDRKIAHRVRKAEAMLDE